MDNASQAAVSVADGAVALAPPSFLGMSWLVVVNLALATLGLLVFSFAARRAWRLWWQDRNRDSRGSAPELARRMAGMFFIGATLRSLSDALSLYGWNPVTQSSGGWATAGRFIDPIGLALMVTATATWLLTETGFTGQLRTPPAFAPLWEDRDTKMRLAIFATLASILALCPVIFR